MQGSNFNKKAKIETVPLPHPAIKNQKVEDQVENQDRKIDKSRICSSNKMPGDQKNNKACEHKGKHTRGDRIFFPLEEKKNSKVKESYKDKSPNNFPNHPMGSCWLKQ